MTKEGLPVFTFHSCCKETTPFANVNKHTANDVKCYACTGKWFPMFWMLTVPKSQCINYLHHSQWRGPGLVCWWWQIICAQQNDVFVRIHMPMYCKFIIVLWCLSRYPDKQLWCLFWSTKTTKRYLSKFSWFVISQWTNMLCSQTRICFFVSPDNSS